MPRWTLDELKAYEMRTAAQHNLQAGVGKAGPVAESHSATAREPGQLARREVGKGGLQEQISKWCRGQWPPWKIIQARSDQRSTIAVGAHDMTIFAPNGRVILIECKAKGKKRTGEQTVWEYEMRMLGHRVHLVYSMEQFRQIVT